MKTLSFTQVWAVLELATERLESSLKLSWKVVRISVLWTWAVSSQVLSWCLTGELVRQVGPNERPLRKHEWNRNDSWLNF